MCDEDTEQDAQAFSNSLSRRCFSALASGAAASLLVPLLNASSKSGGAELVGHDVTVTTPDGESDCYFVNPAEGRHARILRAGFTGLP